MSTDLKKKLGTSISLIGSALMLAAALMIIGVLPFSALGFEEIVFFVSIPGGMLSVGGLMIMRQHACQRSEEDVEAKQGAKAG